ncbi:MAG: ompR [Candidatus Saccharibacteria bacterium]|nr:ompR [Candidatus Saccharibacteria bacterium]
MRILLIEDDHGISLALRQALSTVYVMDIVDNGADGISSAARGGYDIILLDLNLPDMHGLEVCTQMRAKGVTAPILILTADTAVIRKIGLLDAGADDYLTKPFSLGELKARIRVLDRRQSQNRDNTPRKLYLDDLELDSVTHFVARAGKLIKLRRKEFAMLECLLQNSGAVVTREILAAHAWPENEDPWTNTIDVHIKYLRDKIDRPFGRPLIKTVHGLGYKIEAPRSVVNKTKGGDVYERSVTSSSQ